MIDVSASNLIKLLKIVDEKDVGTASFLAVVTGTKSAYRRMTESMSCGYRLM